jgi:hypothetical protein
MFHKQLYILHNIEGGGTLKYIRDLQEYPTYFIEMHHQNDLRSHTFHPYDVILVQQLGTDITPADLVQLHEETGVHLILCIHDFFWFQVHHPIQPEICASAYLYTPTISEDTLELFQRASLVIHPSKFTQEHYARYFPTHNTLVQPHNDLVQREAKRTNRITKVIRIGMLHERSEYKGAEQIQLLQQRYPFYKGIRVQFVHCVHTENDWQQWIPSIHGLLHLNKWGETYCYGLTKSLNSGLPLLYNNLGAYRERIPVREHYVKVAEREEEYTNVALLYSKFELWMDYLLANQGNYNYSFLDTTKIRHDFYTFLCTNDYVPTVTQHIHKTVQPFAVYFPQFHRLKENDINYYPGMTDTLNLYHYNQSHTRLNEPILMSTGSYNATHVPLLQEQVQLAKAYGLKGFAVYYYWFTTNDITHKHTMMEKCYNLLFQLDFPLFFIWANEDWSDNPAFNSSHTITNTYDETNFQKNINHLMRYFKHRNYYKRNNRPVFYLHHPWCMTTPAQASLMKKMDEACMMNGFDGVCFKRNGIEYDFHPNYKRAYSTDYSVYVDQVQETQCMFFDFNNQPRFHFNKRKPCTEYTNVTEQAQQRFMKKAMQKDLVLLNAWNEWGECMTMEPGTQTGDTRMLMLKHNGLPFLADIYSKK